MEDRLIELYDYMFEAGIDVFSVDFNPSRPAMCIVDGKKEIVVLNPVVFNSSYAELCAVAEEVGHIETGATYSLADKDNPLFLHNVKKAEITARRWMITYMVPLERLVAVLDDPWVSCDFEAAEALGVETDIFLEAVELYKERGLLDKEL